MWGNGGWKMIYQAAGRPEIPGNLRGICRVCGVSGIGEKFTDWVRPTFTDFDKLQAGDLICHACLFCFNEKSDLLAQRVGKDKPQRMRNYSHFVLDGEWIPLSKGDKARMRAVLMQLPEVAAVAISGQKHIIFRTQPGWWQIEEQSVRPFPEMLKWLLEPVESLYATFSKSEIETGAYAQHRILKFGLPEWQGLEAQIAEWRGSIQLELAIFLAQRKETETNDGITRKIGGDAGDHLARHPGVVQAPVSDEHLAAIRGPDTIGGIYGQPEQVRQLTLPEA